MKNQTLSNRIGVGREPLVKNDEEIWLYRAGSRGEVVAVYKSAEDIVKSERVYNGKFSITNISNVLMGTAKTFTSLAHQCRVRPVIRKVE